MGHLQYIYVQLLLFVPMVAIFWSIQKASSIAPFRSISCIYDKKQYPLFGLLRWSGLTWCCDFHGFEQILRAKEVASTHEWRAME